MTTSELLVSLARECPNGVSFNPMAVRLLRRRVPVEDWHIENLKALMFQLRNGLWFSREMISDVKTRLATEEQAMEWLKEHGCFSVERLFENFCGVLRHIDTPESCAAFLRHLGYTVAAWGEGGFFCFLSDLNNSMASISETIVGWLEEADGTLGFHEIEQAMPHLTAEALECIRVHFLPEVHEAEVGGVSCWRSADAISLPEDFSEKLTTIVDTLVALDEKVSASRLEFALNLFYRARFREEYALPNNGTFMRVCAKHYQGVNDVFSNTKNSDVKSNESPVTGSRLRSPNTRFRSLGVPVGAELFFTNDPNISCVVLDDVNRVKYAGKAWAISTLAIHLLGVSSANGFCHFKYKDEILWDRRLRLGRAENPGGYESFPNMKSRVKVNESPVPGSRVRSPNTRFGNLGVPVGAELVFIKDPHTSCVVLDDVNQVKYAGKAWAISNLAMYLLGVSSANGFCHFKYDGEILWDRRLRLERAENQDK